jgi:hypothetical protein
MYYYSLRAGRSAWPISLKSNSEIDMTTQLKPANSTHTGFKLPTRFTALITPLIVSILMTGIVSLISLVESVGFVPALWLRSWCRSWLVAFPVLILILPLARRATECIVESARTMHTPEGEEEAGRTNTA